MQTEKFKKKFIKYCSEKNFQQNINQLKLIDLLINYNNKKNSIFNLIEFFKKDNKKLGFYLYGDVGVGKTMILNFFFNNINLRKKRFHFNEFMIQFHDYKHLKKQNSINYFVNDLRENVDLIYLDEFQVTNIVDAMILGKLFDAIFKANIKVIITSNIKIDNLYKDGLQREQFLPFIKIIKHNSIEHELKISEDFRKRGLNKLKRYFYSLNDVTLFKVNQLFRIYTKYKKKSIKKILIKGRIFEIKNYFEGFARFKFNELCDVNSGAEDYIKISDACSFITIENVPLFNSNNINQQLRFITMIDVIYEKKIPLLLSGSSNLENLYTDGKIDKVFDRTISRLYELTSPDFNFIK